MDIFKQYYQGRHVLVTGGAGFIGSHLVEALVAAEALVTVVDNFSTGFYENLSLVDKKIELVEADIQNTDQVKALFALHDYTYIFHAAAFVSVQQSIENPALCHAINYQGTKNIIDAVSSNKKPILVFSSTAALYGNHEGLCKEEMLLMPLSPYAESKLLAEQLIQDAVAKKKIQAATVLRYFNVYGERQNPDGAYASVVPRFIRALHQENPITFFGDGYQTRDFISVHEIVEANLIAAALAEQSFFVCNVATGKSITLHDLVKMLEDKTDKKVTKILNMPAQAGEVRHSQASIDRLVQLKKEFYARSKAAIVTTPFVQSTL